MVTICLEMESSVGKHRVVLQRRKGPSINGKEVFKNSQILSLNKKDKCNSREFLENSKHLKTYSD